MKKQNILVVLLVFFLLNLCSCSNPFGPNKKDLLILAATVERAVTASLKADKNPTEHSVYANAADITFSTPDKTSDSPQQIFLRYGQRFFYRGGGNNPFRLL